MTDNNDDVKRIGEAINGWPMIHARQVGIHQWRVLSWRNDSITAYRVNLAELTCDCRDQAMNKQDNEICDHIAVALEAAPSQMDVSDALAFDVGETVREARDALKTIERYGTGLKADAASGATQDVSGDPDDTPDTADPDARLEAKLEDLGIDPDGFDIWIDDQYGSLQFEQNGHLDDDEYSALMDWVTDDDVAVNWDNDNRRNYIKADDLEEVLS